MGGSGPLGSDGQGHEFWRSDVSDLCKGLTGDRYVSERIFLFKHLSPNSDQSQCGPRISDNIPTAVL